MKSQAENAAEQAAFWNGPGGKMWLAAYDRIQRGIAPFSNFVLEAAAAKPGEKVLDVGCGTGVTTAELAKEVGSEGRVLGVDISEGLIGAARQHKLDNARFEVGDAATYPFETAAFDLVFSRFGVMFFGDPVAAFKNLRRALKPLGRIVFLCWRTPMENPWGLVPMRAAAPHLPPFERPGPEDPGQYSFGDRARVERILKQAGFGTPTFRTLDQQIPMGKDIPETLHNLGTFGPLARLFAEATPEQIAKAKVAIGEALKPHVGPEGVHLAGACWLVSAAQH
jgi:ubiquinone/menaquinone biosynthesis C-methylase UbiE